MRTRGACVALTLSLLSASLAAVAGPAAPAAAATPSTWTWSRLNAAGAVTGTLTAAGRWPGIWMVCDANGDGIDAPAVWRAGLFEPSDGPTVAFGNPNFSQAVCGDWDGNGTDTPGLFAGKTWYLRNRPGSGVADLTISYGFAGVGIAAGDWDGDGRDGIAVLTNSNQWLLRNRLVSGVAQRTLAYPTCSGPASFSCAPVVGDWNGNGTDDPGISRANLNWTNYFGTLTRSGTTAVTSQQPSTHVIAGDWNGDGRDDLGALTQSAPYRTHHGWGANYSGKVVGAAPATALGCDANGDGKDVQAAYDAGLFVFGDGPAVRFGNAAMTDAVCGDWDGNGTDTPGLFVNGKWLLRNKPGSGVADLTVSYGRAGMKPVAGDWNRDGRDGLGLCTATQVLLRDKLTSGIAERAIDGRCQESNPSWVFLGDFSGDGVIGLARVWFFCWDYVNMLCEFDFIDETGTQVTVNGYSTHVLVGDWNGDRRDDWIWIDSAP